MLPLLVFGAGYAGGVLFVSPTPDFKAIDQWLACCETKGASPCSSAKTKAECYQACQLKCGDPDSLVGKKCRQYCNINFA